MSELAKVFSQLDTMKADGASAKDAANFIKQQGMDVKSVANLYGSYQQTGEMPEESGIGTAVLQGLTFGFSEEIGGLIDEVTGGDYDAYVANERAKYKIYKDANPLLALGGEILGSLPSMLVPGGAILKGSAAASKAAKATQVGTTVKAPVAAAQAAPGMLGTSLRGAGQAAAEGAVYGLGTGEGGLQSRIENAATEGLLSGAAGGVMSPISKLYSMGRQMKGMDAQQEAISTLAKRITPETQKQITEGLAEAGQQTGISIADVGGRETQRILRGLRSVSPDAQEYIDSFLGKRQVDQYNRITSLVNESFENNPELIGAVKNNIEKTKELAGAAYTEAFHKHSAIRDADLSNLIKTDDQFKEAYDATRNSMLRAVKNAKDDVGIAKRQALQATPAAKDLVEDSPLSLQVLHNMKVDIDKQRLGAPSVGTEYFYKENLKAMSTDLVDALDSATGGDYGKLVSNFSEAAQLEEKFNLGNVAYSLSSGKRAMTAQELRNELASMPKDQADMYLAGALNSLYSEIRQVGYSGDVVKALLKSPELELRLKAIFPTDEAWERFSKQMANEAKIVQTDRLVRGGSNTADKIEDVAAEKSLLADMAEIMADPTGLTSGGVIARASKNLARGLALRLQTKAKDRGLYAQLLTETDPTKRGEIARQIQEARKRLYAAQAAASEAGVKAGRVTGAAVARMGDNE